MSFSTIYIITLIVCAVAIVWLFYFAVQDEDGTNASAGRLGCALLLGLIIAICISLPLVYQWTSARYRVDIINREYGTKYTQAEIFYADDIINTIQELK